MDGAPRQLVVGRNRIFHRFLLYTENSTAFHNFRLIANIFNTRLFPHNTTSSSSHTFVKNLFKDNSLAILLRGQEIFHNSSSE
jgi:hypothetical protein